jgi:ubiquitin-like-conjugating enzyme ATG10
MLSRSEFELACEAFARRHSSWSWVPAQRPGYGYLTRLTAHFMTPSILEEDQLFFDQPEEDDSATADAQPSRQPLSVQEYIVYSASFNVPAFYFTMYNTSVFLRNLFNSAHLTSRRWRAALPR